VRKYILDPYMLIIEEMLGKVETEIKNSGKHPTIKVLLPDDEGHILIAVPNTPSDFRHLKNWRTTLRHRIEKRNFHHRDQDHD
jgi:hypothetical protein